MNLNIEVDETISLYHTNGDHLGAFEIISGRGNRWSVLREGKKGNLILDPVGLTATLEYNGKNHPLKSHLFFNIEKTPE